MELMSDFPSLRPGEREDFMALSSVDVQGRVQGDAIAADGDCQMLFIDQFADNNLISTGLQPGETDLTQNVNSLKQKPTTRRACQKPG